MAGGAHSDGDDMIAGINVTPLVDIMLVLLIIFMVTAKMIVNQGMPMDLPKASTGQDIQQTVFSVELSADGKTMVDSTALPNDEAISPLAKNAKAKNGDIRAVIRADRKVEHGRVIHVLDLLNRAGISKVAFGVQQVSPAETKAPSTPAPAPSGG